MVDDTLGIAGRSRGVVDGEEAVLVRQSGFDGKYRSVVGEGRVALSSVARRDVQIRDFDRDPDRITEMDALVAYLQMTGTLVDFSTYEAEDLMNRR